MTRALWRAIRQALLLAVLALLPAAIHARIELRAQKLEPLAADEIRPATARQWGSAVQWVDARSQARFEAGHIPGAALLNLDQWDELFPKFLDAWDLRKTVVVYCDGGSCDASRAVADRLREDAQVQSIYVLKGGWPAWQKD